MAAEGEDCTVIAWGTMVHVCEEAIRQSGVSCDLIDLQSLVPWDKDAVVNSVQKTGRCVIVHEAPKTSGFGAERWQRVSKRGVSGALRRQLQGSLAGTLRFRTPLSGTTCRVRRGSQKPYVEH